MRAIERANEPKFDGMLANRFRVYRCAPFDRAPKLALLCCRQYHYPRSDPQV